MRHRKNKPKDSLRFEFVENCRSEGFATIGELLNDLYWDKNYIGRETLTIGQLGRTLGFIQAVAGIKCESATNRLPLVALKTIKLLFMKNHERKPPASKKRNLFNLIDPPQPDDTATMEFATTSSISPDTEGNTLINSLLEKLALEIDADRLLRIDHLLKNATSIMSNIESGTYDSADFLTERIGSNDVDLAQAYAFLVNKIGEYQPEDPSVPTIPLNEIVYTYLRSLGFIHFALHHDTHSKSVRVDSPIPSVKDELGSFCEALNARSNFLIEPHTTFVSINDSHKLIAGFPKQFSSIVTLVTGAKEYKKEQLFEDMVRAKIILVDYIRRNFESVDPDARHLSLHIILAALCSLKYQRESGTSYEPRWPGRDKQPGSSPQRFLDRRLLGNVLSIPQGVVPIYYERFAHYLFAFMGKEESNSGWMNFQSARFNAYARILKSNNIDVITKSIFEFDRYCLEQTAMAFVNVIPMCVTTPS